MNELKGTQLGGCELLDEIGQGGMGQIYRACQVSLDRIVAVKILADHLAHDPSFVERFHREAKAIAKINHPNILAVYDVGHQGNRHYMIMELVENGSLAELLDRLGMLEFDEAAGIVLQAARGLECAARHNIIHRDVKPDNIMIGDQQVAKVSDFGLAKELDSTMTETQAIMGTPAYMSPEQCDGRELDSRTDVYSLGGTFYRCVTGRLPFEADTAMSMMYRHKHVPLVPPHQIAPALPIAYSDIIVKMMAKRRQERFANMTEVVRALEEARQAARNTPDPNNTIVLTDSPPDTTATDTSVPAEDDRPAFLRQSAQPDRKPANDPEQRRDTRHNCMEAAGRLRAEGKLMQAARELRRLLDIVPGDQAAREELQQLERLLGEKRACAMELRNLVASSRYEEALARWESLDVVLRDDQLATQMTHLAQTVVPSMRNADKGDAEARAGRMDSALRLYEEALKQDAGNEKAKLGIKNIERTRQRIQVLLKDGYTCRQHRDYEQAVQIWAKILDVEPQNSQALRLIVEAHLAVANEAFGAEDFDRALRHCEALLTLVPGNKEAVQLQTNATVLRDRVSELRRTAEMARNRGDLSGTAKAYRELTAIIPKSKVARAGLDSTRKALAHHRSKRLLLLLLLVAVVASGFLFWQDYVRVAEARRYWEAQEFARAREAAAHVHFPWLRTEAREIMGKASLDQSLAEATAAQKEGRWADAASALRSAVALSSADAKRTYSLQLMRCEYQHAVSLGRKAEDGGRWDEAQGEYLKAYNVARGANSLAYDSMKGEEEKAERDRLFCAYMAEGSRMEAAGNRIEALGNFGKARGYRSDSDLVDRKIKELSTVSPP